MSIFMYKDEKIINPIEKNLIGLTDISSIGDGTITGAINTLNSLDVNTEAGAHGLRIHNDLLQYNNGLEWKNIEANGALSVQLNAPSNVTVKAGNAKVTLKWTDPEDVTIESGTLATWVETVVVRKENIAPANENDGEVVLRTTTRNQYSSEAYVDNNVTNDVVYYYGIFPKTNSGVYTYSCTKIAAPKALEIVTWNAGTDEQIAAMVTAHYAGDIDIADYWNIGDVRTVNIASFSSGSKTQETQNIQLVIIGIKHDDLTSAINGKTKAAITVQTKQIIGSGTDYREYYWGSSHYPVADGENWSSNPLRTTYLGSNFYNALDTSLKSLIKTVTKKNLSTHTGTTTIDTNDKIFLPSYPEVFGTATYANYISGGTVSNYEGTQYTYFNTSSNRIKYWNNNGVDSTTAYSWWLRSPSSYYNSSNGYYWCLVISGGTALCDSGNYTYGLAPCFTI